jgi:hypothetical protein
VVYHLLVLLIQGPRDHLENCFFLFVGRNDDDGVTLFFIYYNFDMII